MCLFSRDSCRHEWRRDKRYETEAIGGDPVPQFSCWICDDLKPDPTDP